MKRAGALAAAVALLALGLQADAQRRARRPAWQAWRTSASGAGPVLFGDVGPDPTQCVAPLATGLGTVSYYCDCQTGADADCVAGDDTTGAGTAASPWRTISKLDSEIDGGGTAVHALCRGGVWSNAGGTQIAGSNWGVGCSSGTPCTIADYSASWASGDEGKPRIEITSTSNNAFDIDQGGGCDGQWLTFRNLEIVGSGASSTGNAFQILRGFEDVSLACLDISDFGGGVNVQGLTGCDDSGPTTSAAARIVLSDSTLTDLNSQGWLGGCDECGVRRTSFTDVGSLASTAHSVYFSCTEENTGCTATDGFVEYSDFLITGTCAGPILQAHGLTTSGLTYQYNRVRATARTGGCYGISIDGNAASADQNDLAVIRGNWVQGVGNVAIGVGACTKCTVESNLVIQDATGGTGILSPVFAAGTGDATTSSVTVRNNTIVMDSTSGGTGIDVSTEGTDHTVVSNLVYDDGDGTCFVYGLSSTDYALVNRNWAYNCGTTETGTTGQDSNLGTADPLLVNAAGSDYRPSANSPLVDTADPTSYAPADVVETSRQTRLPPDRGAYEYDPANP